MATEIVQIAHDDLDRSHPAEAHTFMLDGETYSIDLSADNARRLREALEPFIKKARKGAPKKPSTASVSARAYTRAVRAWAMDKGYKVPEKGRIPFEVQNAYNEAHLDRINIKQVLRKSA